MATQGRSRQGQHRRRRVPVQEEQDRALKGTGSILAPARSKSPPKATAAPTSSAPGTSSSPPAPADPAPRPQVRRATTSSAPPGPRPDGGPQAMSSSAAATSASRWAPSGPASAPRSRSSSSSTASSRPGQRNGQADAAHPEKQGLTFKLGTKVTGAAAGKTASPLTVERPRAASRCRRSRQGSGRHRPPARHRRPRPGGGRRRRSTSAATSSPMPIRRPTSPASTPSATSSAASCSPTRRRKKASPSPRTSPASGHVNYDAIPGVVYTWPEARRGRQDRGRAEGRRLEYKRQVPLHRQRPRPGDGRHRRHRQDPRRRQTDRVLGVHILGPHAGDMIAEVTMAMEFVRQPKTSPAPSTPTPPCRSGQGSRAGGG